MKTLRYTFVLSAAVLALSACTQNDLADGTNLPKGEYPLVIETTGVKDAASRATVDGNWDGVTDVALQVGAEVKKYSVSASGANKESAILSSTDPFYWTSRENITVTAWWPYNAADLSMPEVKVNADQSSLENFKSSDYIYAHSDAVEFENPTLEFTHRTARVTVTLVEGKGVTSLEGASVSLNGLDTEHENPASVTPYKVSDEFTYDALVAPQTIAQGAAFISVQLNGGTYSYLPDAAIELAAGSRYNYTVKVNAKGLELVGCTITDWTTMGNEEVDANADYSYNASTDTYTVFTAEGLYAWAEHVNARNNSTNCILANDIVLSAVAEGESNWTPINSYNGTFDGNNFTISGLTINGSSFGVGFFGNLLNSGTVKNVKFKDVKINGNGLNFVSSVVGRNFGTITACVAGGDITGKSFVGGIAGLNDGVIIACSSMCNVNCTSFAGGIVGLLYGVKVIACYSTAKITSDKFPGGIVGNASVEDINSKFCACYWSGNCDLGVGTGGMSGFTKVSDDITWETATASMNAALAAESSEWRYVQGEDKTLPPTLQKNQ